MKVDEIIPAFDKISNKDLLKVFVKAVLTIDTIEEVKSISRRWNEFMDRLKKNPVTAEYIVQIQNENPDY